MSTVLKSYRLTDESLASVEKIKAIVECKSEAKAVARALAIAETILEANYQTRCHIYKHLKKDLLEPLKGDSIAHAKKTVQIAEAVNI